ncbi:MAG: hypothetical protein R3F61_07355 [Myxococcota bacterium]
MYCSGLLGLGFAVGGLELVCLGAALVGFAVASVLAVIDRGRGLAGAAGFAIVAPLLAQLGGPVHDGLLFVGCLVYTAVLGASGVVAEKLGWDVEPDVLSVQAPFAAFVASVAVLLHRPVLLIGSYGQEWESSLLLGLYGGLVLVVGWGSGSRFSLVSGLGVLLVAQIPVLWAFGDAILGIAVLGLEGIALIGAAVLALVVRTRRADRDAAPAGGSSSREGVDSGSHVVE